jgi:hypothetical protein
MIYCKNFAKPILLLGLVFLLGLYSSVASCEPIRGDIGGPSGAGVPDGIVDFWDLSILTSEWLSIDPCFADICGADGNSTPDGIVNLWDFVALSTEWPQSTLPLSVIDSIAPNPAKINAPVMFAGHGEYDSGTIMAYLWKVDDVNESNDATFVTSTLAKGLHNVFFAVEDDAGVWSVPVTQTLNIIDTDFLEDLLEDANFCRNSIAFLDGNEYAPGTQRFTTLAVSNVSDCIIHGAENVLERSPVILAPKCSAGGYIYATETNHNNIYRSADGNNWERTTSQLTDAFRIFGTQSGAILVEKVDAGNVKLYKSVVGGQDLHDYCLPPAVLVLPARPWDAVVADIWNFHQAQNGTICLSEYGTHSTFKKSRIYRSTDDGSSFTQVYDEPDFVYHSHRIYKHEASGRWVNVYGDGPTMNKVVMSDDDGITWSTLDPQWDNHFQPVDFLDYGDPNNLLYGSDSVDFIGTFDVRTRKITPVYTDGDRYCPFVFSVFYYNGVYYGGTFNGSNTLPDARKTAIIVSSDLVHWAVYHQFSNAEHGVNKFLGVWGGRIHGIVTLSDKVTWRHFSFTPPAITLVQGLCLDPATVNMLDNPQDSSVENNISHWSASGACTQVTTDALHGTACLRVVGNSGTATVYPSSKAVTVGNTYSGRIWLKANGMNMTGQVRWYVYGTSRYTDNLYFCLSEDDWTEIVLPPVTIGPGETYITIHVCPRSSDWPGPYDFLIDAAQYEAGPPSRWQVGGTPRANETLSKSVSVGESWTEQLLWAPECRSEWYLGFGNQYIKTWYRDPNNYLEFYFDPCDSTFALQATVDGIPQTPIKTSGQYKFYRNGVVRSAIRCDAGSLTLSIAAASAYEHVSGPPIAFLRSGTLISKTGDHCGTSLISCTLLSDILCHTIIPDDKLQ